MSDSGEVLTRPTILLESLHGCLPLLPACRSHLLRYHLSVRSPSNIPFNLFFSINSRGLRPFRFNHFFNSSVLTRNVFGFCTTDTTNSAAHVGSSTTERLKIADARHTALNTVAACTSTEWWTPRRSTKETLHFWIGTGPLSRQRQEENVYHVVVPGSATCKARAETTKQFLQHIAAGIPAWFDATIPRT